MWKAMEKLFTAYDAGKVKGQPKEPSIGTSFFTLMHNATQLTDDVKIEKIEQLAIGNMTWNEYRKFMKEHRVNILLHFTTVQDY